MLGQRLDATRDKMLGIANKIEGRDSRRLTVLVGIMRGIAIRWANLYHNEREQALNRIQELEKQLEELKNG